MRLHCKLSHLRTQLSEADIDWSLTDWTLMPLKSMLGCLCQLKNINLVTHHFINDTLKKKKMVRMYESFFSILATVA